MGVSALKKSQFVGVRWSLTTRKWESYLSANRQHHHIGFFGDEEDAARARDALALQLHGQRASLNFPSPELLGYLDRGDGTTLVPLASGEFAIIDNEDVSVVIAHRWTTTKSGEKQYVMTTMRMEDGSRRTVLLHRFLLSAPHGVEVDHENGNGLDCRRTNLRQASRRQNGANRLMGRNNTSGYKGVSWNMRQQNWYASIMVDGRSISLGHHPSVESAAAAYDRAATRYFGEFARTNTSMAGG